MARIKWERPTEELFKTARDQAQLIILYFGDRADTNDLLNEVDVANHVTAKTVVCVRVAKPVTDAEPEAPVSDKQADTKPLWDLYGVTDEDTFVVADRFGNAAFVTKERALAGKLREVSSHFRGVRKQLRQEVQAAKEALENGDRRTAIEAALRARAFKLTGYDEAAEAGKVYSQLIEQGRKELEAAKDDAEKLEALSKVYAGTEVEAEIKAKSQTVG